MVIKLHKLKDPARGEEETTNLCLELDIPKCLDRESELQ